MLSKIKYWWDWNGSEIVISIVSFILLVGLMISLIGFLYISGAATSYKYNCDLDRKPSFNTSLWIDDSMYAYNPEGFCKKLREKMEQE